MRFSTPCVLALLICLAAPHARAAEKEAAILVPAFDGPKELSESVSTILAMQIWTKLRRHPVPNPRELDFGSGTVRWSSGALFEPSAEFALEAAKGTKSQLVLWGFVRPYGEGVVAQPFLSYRDQTNEVTKRSLWALGNDELKLELGLPDTLFELPPLLLDSEVVEKYSTPNQIQICSDKRVYCTGIGLGSKFRAIRQEGDFAYVESDGHEGWVFLPDLSGSRNDVTNFSSAMLAYVRGDFEQSRDLFDSVSENVPRGPLSFDARILGAISRIRLDGSGLSLLLDAMERNPFSLYAAQAVIMANLYWQINYGQTNDISHINMAKIILDKYRHRFREDDRWPLVADEIIYRIEKYGRI